MIVVIFRICSEVLYTINSIASLCLILCCINDLWFDIYSLHATKKCCQLRLLFSLPINFPRNPPSPATPRRPPPSPSPYTRKWKSRGGGDACCSAEQIIRVGAGDCSPRKQLQHCRQLGLLRRAGGGGGSEPSGAAAWSRMARRGRGGHGDEGERGERRRGRWPPTAARVATIAKSFYTVR